MTFPKWGGAVLALALSACAAQSASDQLQKKDTVRVCQGQRCIDQSSQTVTFQEPATDVQAEQRLQALTELAQANPKAAYDLGLRLLRGDGVARDSYQAIEWLRKAGDDGVVAAQLALGQMYLSGYEEMGADPAEAYAWLSLAAAAGNREAQRLLPQASAAQKSEQTNYEEQQALRTSWGHWLSTAPYYWVWSDARWRQP